MAMGQYGASAEFGEQFGRGDSLAVVLGYGLS